MLILHEMYVSLNVLWLSYTKFMFCLIFCVILIEMYVYFIFFDCFRVFQISTISGKPKGLWVVLKFDSVGLGYVVQIHGGIESNRSHL